jgi:DNA polymerase I
MVYLVRVFVVWVEIHESEIDEIPRVIISEMEEAWKLRVPLRVDSGIGRNWAEAS